MVISSGAIILAAGYSTRMKTPKLFLPFNNNITFIEKIISIYLDWGCSKIVVVTNKQNSTHKLFSKLPFNCLVVVNKYPELERFYSAKLGMQNIPDCTYCFLQNADNPFISTITLEKLFNHKNPEKYIVPTFKGKGGHPVLLGRKVIQNIADYPSETGNLKEILKKYPCKKVPVSEDSILVNINTEEDYKKYF